MPQVRAWNAAVASDIIAAEAQRPGAALPILHALQEEFGFIDDAAIPLVAEALNRTRAEVHGIVTFYHDFRHHPPGRHVLKLCRAEACQATGGDWVAETLLQRLGVDWGGTTADGSITVEPVYCLGLCACSPAALLDGVPLGRLTAARLDGALAESLA